MKRYLPLLLLPLAALLVPAPAQAAACTGRTGVTVLVQYGNGPTQVGCAKGDPASGFDALAAAGFDVVRVQQFAAVVCRINGYPTPAHDACAVMPPSKAYWAYFHADPNAKDHGWVFSTDSAASYDPAPGTVEGWRFDDARSLPPSAAPPFGSAVPTPTKKPSAHPSRHPTASADVEPVETPSIVGATPTATPQTFDEPGPVTPSSSADSSGGLSWIWGVALVGVLAVVGGIVALRRRQG